MEVVIELSEDYYCNLSVPIALFTVMSSSKIFQGKLKNFLWNLKELDKIRVFFKISTVSNTFCLAIIGSQNFCFPIVFILWLAYFANQHTKSIEKHKHFSLIAPKQVKTDMPCGNKALNLHIGAFRCFFRYQFFSLGQKFSHFRVCLETVKIAIPIRNERTLMSTPSQLQALPLQGGGTL